MPDYEWKPIERISDADRKVGQGAIDSLYESWRAAKNRLKQSSGAQLADFNNRLIRRFSVETGILERLYDLDRGTTEALVANGFLEDLVAHNSTNIEPGRLIDILRDHEAAVQLVIDCVAQSRPLTKGLMHELQSILTRHQDSTTAIDGLGRRFEIPLRKAQFKDQPNNPTRPDGTVHGYCPPIHVDAEVDNLLAWIAEYSSEDPVLVAAWLHHRFTQIHPYQDGNGRVARALTTLVLLRANLLPVVVDRDLRTDYLSALEAADRSNLAPLVDMFSRLEKNAILQALSVDADVALSSQKNLTSAVIGALSDKLGRRKREAIAELRRVNTVASELRAQAERIVRNSLDELEPTLVQLGAPNQQVMLGGPEEKNSYWYQYEVVQSANELQSFANLAEDHYFVLGLTRVKNVRMTFLVSFHHVGRELSGIMEAIAISQLSFDERQDEARTNERFALCSTEPFAFSHLSKAPALAAPFAQWLDAALAVAIKEFADRL